ncbi:hypothetical protein HNQ77_004452 [Silvibacterium bohemicum]|uniref:Glycosyltransferase RgtA/B/C/D-like domain-containing protein n=1 Tax=Silvibacterium bohemicum TaxID=1577686 RepID=A0A841JYE3_9BACT|nr:hypothetical protein [Silvibacterium bohemicum]MBB6146473.1 hypothetical protein [Silvibacterium bohemicum]
MPPKKRFVLTFLYVPATIQFAWCYFWLTRPYVNTALYEQGLERMPFQGRMLMIVPMRLAHSSLVLGWFADFFKLSQFWFPRPVAPEVMVQAAINVVSLLVVGWLTTRIYQASSQRRLLTPLVYPLVLVACGATYVMHTVQNFRFIYDLPSLAFFSGAMYLLYFRKHWAYFAALFVVATINRETTLLLLPLYLINEAAIGRNLRWTRAFRLRTLLPVLSLAAFWGAWQLLVRHLFAHNPSEFYPRINWNVKSLLAPQAWPQLLSTSGYLLIFVIAMRKKIVDPRLRAWLWLVPVWFVFMFVFGILIETRVFGELIPFVACATTLIFEEILAERMGVSEPGPELVLPEPALRIGKAA